MARVMLLFLLISCASLPERTYSVPLSQTQVQTIFNNWQPYTKALPLDITLNINTNLKSTPLGKQLYEHLKEQGYALQEEKYSFKNGTGVGFIIDSYKQDNESYLYAVIYLPRITVAQNYYMDSDQQLYLLNTIEKQELKKEGTL